jgi:hypothetical protein
MSLELAFIAQCVHRFPKARMAKGIVLDPAVIDYIEGDHTVLERGPLERLAGAGQHLGDISRAALRAEDVATPFFEEASVKADAGADLQDPLVLKIEPQCREMLEARPVDVECLWSQKNVESALICIWC